ncbi:MAG: hypothetical protein ABWZ79_04975 [Pedobacter agri]
MDPINNFFDVENDELLKITDHLKSDLRFTENNFTYNLLYISSINKSKFSFTNKFNEKFFPPFTSVYFSSFMHLQKDMDGAGFITNNDPLSSSYFKLKPYQSIFYGKSRRSQDLWSLSISFILPDRFKNIISSIEFEEVQRENSSSGMDKTPKITLTEMRIVNGQPITESLINENLPTANTAYKKYDF